MTYRGIKSVLLLPALCYFLAVIEPAESQNGIRRGLESESAPDVQFAGVIGEVSAQSIVGGSPANASEVPWFVHFGDKSCGGSLISRNRVLTAAHCVFSVGHPASVRVGASTQNDGRTVPVTCATVHPNYNRDIVADVAVLKLAEDVTDVPFIQINNNTAYPNTDNQPLKVIGLGRTVTNGPAPNVLLEVDKSYVPDNECDRRIGFNIINNNAHICADGDNKAVCNGDSGGPLFDANFLQVGIVSFGIERCASGFPDGYTQVSTYSNWIQEQLTDESCDILPPPFCPFDIFCIYCRNVRDYVVSRSKSLLGFK